jgi:hypothetical protein
MIDIERWTTNVNLDTLAEQIRREFGEISSAGRSCLEHAIAAGQHLLQARKQIGRGFRRWLQQHDLKKTCAYECIQLAEHAETVRTSGHSSIHAALRGLRSKGSPRNSTPKPPPSPLNKAAWDAASLHGRRRFLDAVGSNALCAAFSVPLRAELRRRVGGRKPAATSPLEDTVAKAIRQALSLQLASKDMPTASVAAALNAINAKLAAAGMDLNNIAVMIDPTMTQRRAA